MQRLLAFLWTPLLIAGYSTTERKWDFLLPSATMQELMDLDANSTVDPMAVDRRVDSLLRSLPQPLLDQMDLPPFYDSLPFGERWQIKAILFDRRLSYEQKHQQIIGVVEKLPAEVRRRMEVESDERRSRYFEGFSTLQYRVTFNFRLRELRQTLSADDAAALQRLLADSQRSVESKAADIERLMSQQPVEVLDRLFFSGVPIVDAEIRERFRRLFTDRGYWSGGAAIPPIPVSANPWLNDCGPFCGDSKSNPVAAVPANADAKPKSAAITHQIVIKPVPAVESSARTPFAFPHPAKTQNQPKTTESQPEPPCPAALVAKPADPKPAIDSKSPPKPFPAQSKPAEPPKPSGQQPKSAESPNRKETAENRPTAPFYSVSHQPAATSDQTKAPPQPGSDPSAHPATHQPPTPTENQSHSAKPIEEPKNPKPLKNWADAADLPSIVPHPFARPLEWNSNPTGERPKPAEINPIDGSATNPRRPAFPAGQINPIDGSSSATVAPKVDSRPAKPAKWFWDQRKPTKVFAPTAKWRPAPNRWAAIGEGTVQPMQNPWSAAATAYNRKESAAKNVEPQKPQKSGGDLSPTAVGQSRESGNQWPTIGNGFAAAEQKPDALAASRISQNANMNSQSSQIGFHGSQNAQIGIPGSQSSPTGFPGAPSPQNPHNPNGNPQTPQNQWKTIGNGFAADSKPQFPSLSSTTVPARAAAWTHTDEKSFLRKWYEKFGVRLRDQPKPKVNWNQYSPSQSGNSKTIQPDSPKSPNPKSVAGKIANPMESANSQQNPTAAPKIILNPKKSEKSSSESSKPLVGISPSAVEFPPLPGASTAAPPASPRPWPAFDSVPFRQSPSAAVAEHSAAAKQLSGHEGSALSSASSPQSPQNPQSQPNPQNGQKTSQSHQNSQQSAAKAQPNAETTQNPVPNPQNPEDNPTAEHDRVERHGVRRNGVGEQPTSSPPPAAEVRTEIRIPTVTAKERKIFAVQKPKPKELSVSAAITVNEPKPKELNVQIQNDIQKSEKNEKTEKSKSEETNKSKSEDKSKTEEENQKEESEEQEKSDIVVTALNDSADHQNTETTKMTEAKIPEALARLRKALRQLHERLREHHQQTKNSTIVGF